MCTLFIAYKCHPKYDLIFLGNRDEFKSRNSIPASFLEEYPEVIAGIDALKGGTWTGISQSGRMAFITNFRDLSKHRDLSSSRGQLTLDFLVGSSNPLEYLEGVNENSDNYNPYNIILGDLNELYFYSNMEKKITLLKPGIYGLSNGLLNEPWPKVKYGMNQLENLVKNDNVSFDALFDILDNKDKANDEELPATGVSLEIERVLSSLHIDHGDYGTVFKTVITIEKSGKVNFLERSLHDSNFDKTHHFYFNLKEAVNDN